MQLLTAPTAEPVTTAEAAAAARVAVDGPYATQLPGLITAARQLAEHHTGRWFMQQTWRLSVADWPAADEVLPAHQATAAAVSYWNGSGWVSLSGAAFAFYAIGHGTGIAPAIGTSWPTLGDVAGGPRVRVDITAGVAAASGVDEAVKLYIKALVAYWIDTPHAATPSAEQVPAHLVRLLDGQRLYF